jgi:hypothetical protein
MISIRGQCLKTELIFGVLMLEQLSRLLIVYSEIQSFVKGSLFIGSSKLSLQMIHRSTLT